MEYGVRVAELASHIPDFEVLGYWSLAFNSCWDRLCLSKNYSTHSASRLSDPLPPPTKNILLLRSDRTEYTKIVPTRAWTAVDRGPSPVKQGLLSTLQHARDGTQSRHMFWADGTSASSSRLGSGRLCGQARSVSSAPGSISHNAPYSVQRTNETFVRRTSAEDHTLEHASESEALIA